MDKIKTCLITGETPNRFPWDYHNEALPCQKKYRSALKNVLERYIEEGYRYFINGGAKGVDEDIAALLTEYRKRYPDIRFEIVRPYRKAIGKADILAVFWRATRKGNTYKQIKYAEKRSKEIDFFFLPDYISVYEELQRSLTLFAKIHTAKEN